MFDIRKGASTWRMWRLIDRIAWRARFVVALVAALVLVCPERGDTADISAPGPRALATDRGTWTGDFKSMMDRRLVRVAVPYSRSLFYHDRGRERGLTADLVRKFEEYINKKHKKGLNRRPITVALIPTTRDQLIPALVEGRADIAAGNITITEGRRQSVDFSLPISKPFSEIVVTGPGGPALAGLDDLAGREVFVRPATSYGSAPPASRR